MSIEFKIEPNGWLPVPTNMENTLAFGERERVYSPRYIGPNPNGTTMRQFGIDMLPYWELQGGSYAGFAIVNKLAIELFNSSTRRPQYGVEAFLRIGHVIMVGIGRTITWVDGYLDIPLEKTVDVEMDGNAATPNVWTDHLEFEGANVIGNAADFPTDGVVLPNMKQIGAPQHFSLSVLIRFTVPFGSTGGAHAIAKTQWQTVERGLVNVVRNAADVNADGVVNGLDIAEITNRANFGKPAADAANALCDVNLDGIVNGLDVALVKRSFGEPSET